jgi:hypothetical protein
MKVFIETQHEMKTVDMEITTVYIGNTLDNHLGRQVFPFHCLYCGQICAQFKGHVDMIVAGMPYQEAYAIVLCTKCKRRYAFP